MSDISREYLRELFEYRDGFLYWREKKASWLDLSKPAGCQRKDGYYVVRINQKNYLLHRLIFLYHFGFLPRLIDHKDQNPSNSKIENLRPYSKKHNAYNSKMFKNNTSGIRGVSWDKTQEKWTARFKHDGAYTFLGYFKDIEDARRAREEMERRCL